MMCVEITVVIELMRVTQLIREKLLAFQFERLLLIIFFFKHKIIDIPIYAIVNNRNTKKFSS